MSYLAFLKKTPNKLVKVGSCCSKILKKLISKVKNFINKLSNLKTSNLNLGKLHIQRGNISDAILRFKLVDKFLDPGNKIASYWLLWSYVLNNDFKEAKKYINRDGVDKELARFIKKFDNITVVPTSIYSLRRELIPKDYVNKFQDQRHDIVKILVKNFLKQATNLPSSYAIAEFGSADGILSNELSLRLQNNFKLISTELSRQLIKLQTIHYSGKKLQDELHCMPAEEYIKNCQRKFDAIFSLEGFSYYSDLSNFFKKIYDLLKEKGYFAFVLRDAKRTHCNFQLLEYSYNKSEIELFLTKNKFIILSKTHFPLDNGVNYNIFICCK
ncbi:MAG TPA: class I SAM-dependent methyltransferase [Candidatus Megaira endosymbiont of Nemacystus decipiens]|nr:class I SAM-dependent methyltransferase [Candidatus Megaera endosymbiont of Nemacystus decipiens]